MNYYIADLHFGDARIFEKCLRPFKNLQDYEEQIINNWNQKVKDNDVVYVLGDLAYKYDQKVIALFRNLKGHKNLIIGNHDLEFIDLIKESKVFESVKSMDFILDNNREVHLCHYPIMDWMNFNYGSYHIYGHIHNKTFKQGIEYQKIKEYFQNLNAYNCSCDVINYEPVTLDEMIKLKEEHKNDPYIN